MDAGCEIHDARWLSGHNDIEFVEGAGGGFAYVHGELDPGGEQVGNVHGHGGEVFVEGDGYRGIVFVGTDIEVGAVEALEHGEGDIFIQS